MSFTDHFGAIEGMNHVRNANLKKMKKNRKHQSLLMECFTFLFFDVRLVPHANKSLFPKFS